MKKFNVKALSLAVAAAVVSGAAAAEEVNFAQAVGGKEDQGQAAFATVFGEGTKFDKESGKLTFKKDADALLLKTMELEQAVNGFAAGSNFVATNEDGSKTVREATNEDIEADEFKGLGLKEAVATHDEALGDLTETVNENSEALVKTAEVVNAISADVTANTEAIKTKADKADVEAAQKAAAQAALATIENAQELNGFKEGDQIVVTKDDGSKVIRTATKEDVENDDLDGLGLKEVVAQHDASLYDLTDTVNENSEALVKTAEVVNTISADVNANKAALEEQKEANEGFNNAIASLDKDIGDLASAGKAAMEALEVNRQDIDANKAAIETKADKADFEELAKYTADMGKKVNDIGDEVTALSDATNAAITRQDKDIVDLAKGLQLAAEAVEDNRKEIDANKAAIETKADKADFEELAKYTADMGKKVNDIGDEVTALSDATNAAITRHDKDIVDLAQAGLKATEALEANRKDIDANKKYIGDLALAGKAAADALEANRQDIDANKAAIAENTAKLEEQKEANEGFNNAIASLDKDIGDLASAGKAAMEALEVNRQDIDANKAAIETKADKTAVESVRTIAVEAEKSAKSVQDSVEVAQKSAETAESHAKAAKTSADAANNVASAAQTAAAQAQDAVKANAAQVEANKANIATLQTASNQHAAGIAKNSARIDSLDKNVANLRKETRQGLAAQAALSGLFQPYSVGKFNVTAALGGFKSDTAVAVGAGYRFNENFAAKAGLAVGTSSGGSASYNVGVNYEW